MRKKLAALSSTNMLQLIVVARQAGLHEKGHNVIHTPKSTENLTWIFGDYCRVTLT